MNEWHLVPLIRHGRVYVIKDSDIVIGSVQYILDWNCPKKAYMFGVAVSENYRGKGVGTKLLIESFEALKKENIEEVELTVDPENAAAVNVYHAKLGFEVTDFRKNEYGDGEDRLVMLRPFIDKSK